MATFMERLRQVQSKPGQRRWLFVPPDQLSADMGPLARETPGSLGILLIESHWHAERRPYHKQKLALVFTNLRHFALEQARRGVAVRYTVAQEPYAAVLRRLGRQLGPIRVMQPAERELRADLQPLVDAGQLQVLPHEGWLTTADQFRDCFKSGPAWRMDAFYRYVRRATGILMEGDKPIGGKFSYDPENRLPWKGKSSAPQPPTFPSDPIKAEVGDLIRETFAHHPGRLELDALPATAAEAEALWSWAKTACLPLFGPYQDAMATASRTLFHTRISPLMNLHRLLPARVLADALDSDVPLPSKEGFVRQVLGWREYVRHVHETTDGFRDSGNGGADIQPEPGDGGYARWAGRPWLASKGPPSLDGGARPRALGWRTPLPPAYWGQPSGLNCLDTVVASVWEEGYSHHITRLMVLANIATLLDVSPRQLTDWFWAAYTDAYDWVVEPNVLGMGTYAVGDLMTTKPYVSGGAYINRMSDYCAECAFNPNKDCPITAFYWAFLSRHREVLKNNARLRVVMASLGRRDRLRRRHDETVFQWACQTLIEGASLTPQDVPTP